MPEPTVTVIVSTYKSPRSLDAVLESLYKQSRKPEQIIVAEDSEDTETQKVISKYAHKKDPTICHVAQEDLGFRKSRILNTAIRKSTGEYIIFLDGDCIATPKFIKDHCKLAEPGYFVQGRRAFIKEKAVEKFLSKKNAILRLALTNNMHGLFKAMRLPYALININQTERGVLGCNIGIWKNDLLKINGFDEAFIGWGREDSEMIARLYHTGIKRKFVYGRAIVYHLNHPENNRNRLSQNHSIFENTKKSKKTQCIKGIIDLETNNKK